MPQFNLYAQYYDLLYKEKDYWAEAEYVSNLIKRSQPDAKSILNLGCGTGRHDFALTEMGYQMTGVDLSKEMIKQARGNLENRNAKIRFEQGDIRRLSLGKKFDAVISLFHVISYQTTNKDLLEVLKTVGNHLKPGGIFIFDCWYGPGVLTDPPVVRIKRMENEHLKIIRLAEPVLHPNENVVDVNYTILIHEKKKDLNAVTEECHSMRYLFAPEIKYMLNRSSLEFINIFEWKRFELPLVNTWNACIVCQKST